MAYVQAENVLDFVRDTLKDLGKPKFTDLSSNLQDHVAMSNLLRQNRVVLDSGQSIEFRVLVGQSAAARNVSLGQSDNVNLYDGMILGETNWRHSETSYMMIGQLMAMNREPARIVDYVKTERLKAMISLAELMEGNFWNAPSASDTLTPLGLPYWVTKNATKGFTGGTLSGYTTIAGINTTTYPAWNNFAASYAAVSRDDFIRTASEAATKTKFKPTVDGIPNPSTGDSYGFYTNYAVYQPLEESLRSANDNLGDDVVAYDGNVKFRRTPVTWVPKLDPDTTNPFYGINWGWFKTWILRDYWMKETDLTNTPGQHNVNSHFVDLSYAFLTKNRRCHFVLSNGTSYPS